MIKSFYSFILQILLFFTVMNVLISSQTIVGEFGKYKITLDEFEYAYAKNVGGWVIAEKDSFLQYKDFMDLYLNFRMKLRNAYVRGFDTDPELKKELLEEYEEIKEDALELISSQVDSLLKTFDFEREKRSRFQYRMDEEIKKGKALTSLQRAKHFVFEMKKLL